MLPKLQDLRLDGVKDVDALQGTFPHLTRLDLAWCDFHDPQTVKNLVKNLHVPALEELDLGLSGLTLNGLVAMAGAGAGSRWPNLRSLTMAVPAREDDQRTCECWADMMRNYETVKLLMHSIGPGLRCAQQEEDVDAFACDDLEVTWYHVYEGDGYCWEKE